MKALTTLMIIAHSIFLHGQRPTELNVVLNGSNVMGVVGVDARYGNTHLSYSVRPQMKGVVSHVTSVSYVAYKSSVEGLTPFLSLGYASRGDAYTPNLTPYGYDIANISFIPTYYLTMGLKGTPIGGQGRLYGQGYIGIAASQQRSFAVYGASMVVKLIKPYRQ